MGPAEWLLVRRAAHRSAADAPPPASPAPTPVAVAPREVAPEEVPPPAPAGEGTCLMWYACGCNVGCSKIAEPRFALNEGMEVSVVSGVQAGESGFVHHQRDPSGASVFSLSHHAPGAPVMCSLPDPRYLGYLCEVSKSGALDAHACDSGC